MRIIAGRLGGRSFQSPRGHRTHPMSERIRGAIFNMLGDIEGLTVLDAFSGSGALTFEAISRGAKHATAIDIDKAAHRVIQENADALDITNQVKAIRANASGWSANNPDVYFDIVICDPPFDNLPLPMLHALALHAQQEGIIVYSLPPRAKLALPPGMFDPLATKSFGDAKVVVYRRVG